MKKIKKLPNFPFSSFEGRDYIRRSDIADFFAINFIGRYLVEPDDLLQVYSGKKIEPGSFWSDRNFKQGAHKALLIKSSIKPTKPETCADILRIVVAANTPTTTWLESIKKRARAAIEREREK